MYLGPKLACCFRTVWWHWHLDAMECSGLSVSGDDRKAAVNERGLVPYPARR